jgi:hypothetical protein
MDDAVAYMTGARQLDPSLNLAKKPDISLA